MNASAPQSPAPQPSEESASFAPGELMARIEQLESALRPFVDAYSANAEPIGDSDLYNEQPRAVYVTLGDCRKAARILAIDAASRRIATTSKAQA
jgi:hypothetical protein